MIWKLCYVFLFYFLLSMGSNSHSFVSCTSCTLHECLADLLYKRQGGKGSKCLVAHLSNREVLPPTKSRVWTTMLRLIPALALFHYSLAATTAPLVFFKWTNLIIMISLMQETYTETRDVTDNGGSVFSCTYSLSYDPNTAKVFLPPPIKPPTMDSTCPFPIRPYFPIHPYIEKVYRQESSVSCDPNTNGKQTEELLIIEVIWLLESKSMIVLQSKTVFFEYWNHCQKLTTWFSRQLTRLHMSLMFPELTRPGSKRLSHLIVSVKLFPYKSSTLWRVT